MRRTLASLTLAAVALAGCGHSAPAAPAVPAAGSCLDIALSPIDCTADRAVWRVMAVLIPPADGDFDSACGDATNASSNYGIADSLVCVLEVWD